MPVYDPEKEKTFDPPKTPREGYHDDLGVHPERREAEVADLERAYSGPDAKKPSRAEKQEKKGLDDSTDEEGFDKGGLGPETKKGRLRGWRRKAAGGAVAGFLGAGTLVAILSLSSGPLQFLHFSQLLQQFHFSESDDFGDSRTGRLIQFARTRNTQERRNMRRIGNRIADSYTRRLNAGGIDFEYTRRRVTRIYLDVGNTLENEPARRALNALESDPDGPRPVFDEASGRYVVDVSSDTGFSSRRAGVKTTVGALGLNDVSTATATRILIKRAGLTLHPIRRLAIAGDEKFFSFLERFRADRAERLRADVDTDIDIRVDEDGTSSPDGSEPTPESRASAETAAEQARGTARGDGTPSARAARLKTGLTAGFGVAGFVALTCGLQQIGEAAGELQTSNIVKPLMRVGMEVISIGSQIKSGDDITLDSLGAYSQFLYDKEEKTSWAQAESIQAEQGKPNTGVPMSKAAIPGTSKPLFFDELDAVLGLVPGTEQVCGAVTSTAGNIVLTAGGIIFTASGPFSLLANVLVEGAQYAATNAFLDDLIRWIAGEQIGTNVAGAMYGNYANYGAFLANNDRMSKMGGRELTDEEVTELDQLKQRKLQNELQNKNFFARMFDLQEPNSLAAKTILENPTFASTQSATNGLARAPLSTISSVFSNVAGMFTANTSAAITYDYGVPEIGYSVAELNGSIANEDPYINADIVERKLDELNEEYGECFAATINPETGAFETDDVTSYIGRDRAKCDSGSPDLLRYRLYQADMSLGQAMTCYDGDEQACSNLGFELPGAGGGSGASLAGVECPSTLQPHPTQAGYFRMPDAPNNEYVVYAREARRYGSEQLVCVLYSVAMAYAQAYPGQSQMYIGDLNAAGHKSHYKGIAVDVQSRGSVVAADSTEPGFSEEATVTMGNLFVDTGVMKNLWWCHQPSLDQIVAYANSKGTPFEGAKCISGHDNHFHIDIKEEFALPGRFTP